MRVEKVIRARPWTALGVLATAQFLVVLATSIVNVALPELRTGLGLSASGLSWVVNAYVLVFGALLLLGGRLGDVYGRRRVFLAGTAIFTLSLVAAGAAGNAAVLIAARAAQGVGAALLAPAALALVLTLFPAGEGRGTALGVWGAVSGAGGAAGVLLGGVLSGAFGWRSVFFAVVPIAVAVLLTTAKYVEADVPRGGHLDPVGAVTVTAGLVAVTYGLSATSVLPLIAGLILLVVFVLTQRGTAAPLVPSGIFSIGSVAAANVLMALVGAVWIGLFFFLPLYQQRVLGYSPVLAGVTQLPMALTITAASWTAPKLARRFTGRTVLTGGLAVQAIGLAWLSLTPADASFAADLLGPTLLVGAGLGVAFVQLTTASAAGVPAEDSGLAGGLINTTRQVGGALGLALLTAVSSGTDYGTAFLTAAAISCAAAALAPFMIRS